MGCGTFTTAQHIQENTVTVTRRGQACDITFSGSRRNVPGNNQPITGVPQQICPNVPCPNNVNRQSLCIGRNPDNNICNPPPRVGKEIFLI